MSNPIVWPVAKWCSMYAMVVIGFAFGIWAGVQAFFQPEVYHMVGSLVGFMCAFHQADRNVYYKRLNNLAALLDESDHIDIKIKRVNYTDYEVVKNDE